MAGLSTMYNPKSFYAAGVANELIPEDNFYKVAHDYCEKIAKKVKFPDVIHTLKMDTYQKFVDDMRIDVQVLPSTVKKIYGFKAKL